MALRPDHELVRMAMAELHSSGSARRANPAETRFLENMRSRAEAGGDTFQMTEQQRTNFVAMIRTISERTRWRSRATR